MKCVIFRPPAGAFLRLPTHTGRQIKRDSLGIGELKIPPHHFQLHAGIYLHHGKRSEDETEKGDAIRGDFNNGQPPGWRWKSNLEFAEAASVVLMTGENISDLRVLVLFFPVAKEQTQ
ncbi:hypothetical protein BaRGS_00016085 [Batillaria attramentaria]|uniref:Uncharacterized protein n=1 Tax=Batillaria attramentaria TaxID=370345 RepID=A0ABD0L032_9CAEN